MLCGLLLALASSPAAGQGAPAQAPAASKWQIEVHAGGVFSTNPTSGTGTLPPPGATFNTLSQLPSRFVPSWFFGDGALLLNQVSAALNLPTRMTPLDAALMSRGTERGSGGDVGFRVNRRLTDRLDAEFNVDYNTGSVRLTDGTRDVIETARSAFSTAFEGLFASRPDVFRNATTLTNLLIEESHGRQVFTTGAVKMNVWTRQSLAAYLTAGGGAVFNNGGDAIVRLFGTYAYRFPSGSIADTDFDSVLVRYTIPDRQGVAVFGGGITGDISPVWGWRVDARAHVGRNTARVRIDTQPGTGFQPIGSAFTFATSPALQFSSLREVPATLSNAALTDVTTFTGRGQQVQTSLTAGVFTRVSSSRGPARLQPGQASPFEFGVKGGLTVSTFAVTPSEAGVGFDSRSGITAGVYTVVAAHAPVAFQPELLVGTRGATLSIEDVTASVRLTYLEVPLLARVTMGTSSDVRIFAVAGPSIAMRLAAHSVFGDETENISDETRAADVGLLLGGGLVLGRAHVEVRYTWGLRSVNPDDDDGSVRNRALSLMVGWRGIPR